jgi:hypothetical protein
MRSSTATPGVVNLSWRERGQFSSQKILPVVEILFAGAENVNYLAPLDLQTASGRTSKQPS